MGEHRRETNRERRLREPLESIPEPYPTTRERRSDSEKRGRHLEALRQRLDRLVHWEEMHGDQQESVDRNRAERNALVWVLNKLAEEAGQPAPAKPPMGPDPEYVTRRLDDCEQLIKEGYVRTDPRRPGVLLHKLGDDLAPVEVPLIVWFYFRGRESH